MKKILLLSYFIGGLSVIDSAYAQEPSTTVTEQKVKKNIIRYNVSRPLLFGFDNSVILGYERILSTNQSFSVNLGTAGFPKLVHIDTDSFSVVKDLKNSGFNGSLDYRFYLRRENKYPSPRGVYIGPYYLFTKLNRENSWAFKNSSNADRYVTTNAQFNTHMMGIELGYQFVFWKIVTLDMVLVGPGVGWYKVKARTDNNLSPDEKQQLLEGIQEMLEQKFPGFEYVFSGNGIDASGNLKATSLGFRYAIHIGFRF